MESSKSRTIDVLINDKIEIFHKYASIFYIIFLVVTMHKIFKTGFSRGYQLTLIDMCSMLFGALFSYVNVKISIWFAKKYLNKFINEKYRPNETRQDKIQRCGNYVSGIIFYSIVTIATFACYKDTFLYPKIYGGDLDLSKEPFDNPQRLSQFGNFVYMFHLGHYLNRSIKHFKDYRSSQSFYQFLGHHSLTLYLVILSYVEGYTYWGVTFFFFCDISEIPVNLTQLLKEFKISKIYPIASWVVWVLIWIYTRIWGFIYEFFGALIAHYQKRNTKNLFENNVIVGILASLLLLGLNIFWLFMMFHSAYRLIWKQQQSNYLNQIVEKSSTNKKIE